MKVVEVSTMLPMSPQKATELMIRSDTLIFESTIFTFKDSGKFPEIWQSGQLIETHLVLLGLVPLGPYSIYFSEVDGDKRYFRTSEGGGVVQRWEHLRSIKEVELDGFGYDDECILTDRVEIEAGWMTWLVCLIAKLNYRHRQKRWSLLAEEEACKANALL